MVNGNPGISASELSEKLRLALSTMARFIDALEHKGLWFRYRLGKTAEIFAPKTGRQLQQSMKVSGDNLEQRLFKILGREFSEQPIGWISEANQKFES